jgi:hypothetical protein
MKILKKHARFLAVLLVLMIILFIANSRFNSMGQAIERTNSQARSLFQNSYRALFTDAARFDGEPATLHSRRIQDRTQAALQEALARAERMEFRTGPDFIAPAGADAADQMAFYQARDLELQRELGFKRHFAIDVRSPRAFGFERPAGERAYTSADVERYLRMLDIAHTVSESVERSGVARLTSLEFRNLNEQLAARGVPTRGTTAYLSGTGLIVQARGTEEALYNLLIDLQRPGKGELSHRYLAVESFKLDKPDLLDPRDNLIDATLHLVAYRINEDSPYPEQEAEQQQQTTRAVPDRFR